MTANSLLTSSFQLLSASNTFSFLRFLHKFLILIYQDNAECVNRKWLVAPLVFMLRFNKFLTNLLTSLFGGASPKSHMRKTLTYDFVNDIKTGGCDVY